jgi:hypothetical protein
LGEPRYDGRHGIARHQAGQDKIQYKATQQRDQEPNQLSAEIPHIAFQSAPPRKQQPCSGFSGTWLFFIKLFTG